ncbi:MAG: hypothetical protein ACR2F1_00420 [Nitrososphaeraceae archaeon]
MHLVYDDIDDTIKFVLDITLKEAKREDRLTKQIFITMLSAYSNNPINLLINAPSGVGKNYVINKVASLFPEYDIISLAGMTDKALFHRSGALVLKNEEDGEYVSIEDRINNFDEQIDEKEFEVSNTKDRSLKQGLKYEIKEIEREKKDLLKDAKKLIDLSNKIIIFLDTPSEQLLSGLLPLLSHDKYEVEYEYVDTHNGIKTKNNVLRGWPAVIIAQALDYSNSPRYPEYQRRFISANPTMSQEKYNEAIDLISTKFSNPDLVYQKEVVSDGEKDKAREIIIGLKQQIRDICMDVKPGKNNIIIPFSALILGSLPKEKSDDMTRANRLYTYLSFLPVVYFHKRPRIIIVKQGDTKIQTIPIATFEDLQNTVSLMEYSDGVRPYILEWFYDVFYKAFEDKEDKVDSKTNSKEVELKEERVALTTQNLINKHKEVHNETLTGKKILQTYVYPLLNQGYIDNIPSILDGRAKIYYPVIETKKYKNLFQNDKKNNFSQERQKIIVNSTIFPDKTYILSRIEPFLKYSSEIGYYTKIKNHLDEEITIDELIDQYVGNPDDYFTIVEQKQEQQQESLKKEESTTPAEVKGWNSVPNPTDNINNPTNPETSTTTNTIQDEKKVK